MWVGGPRLGIKRESERKNTNIFQAIFPFCHSQQPEEAQGEGRPAASAWDGCDASCPDNSTPSMSWDNLSPEPSPALIDTQPPNASKGTTPLARTIPPEDNENYGGIGYSSLTPVRGSTYTISCQSAGEG